jgi:radical SAM protein (TIGR01212 family)
MKGEGDNNIVQFNGTKRYNDFGSFIKAHFSERVQKISVDTGFTCPNRDGSKGVGGCTYCNNNSFNPNYCKPEKNITEQLNQGIDFFMRKGKTTKFLAYFQAYTNTYADIAMVKELYLEALNHPQIVGLVIGTRPDCIDEDVLNFLAELAKVYFISLEFGIESTMNKTLEKVNRCHTFEETVEAYELSKDRGLFLGAHLILGLPGESGSDMLKHAAAVSKLPIHSLKLHHLQIVKYTMMAAEYRHRPDKFALFGLEDYLDLVTDFVALLRPDIIIERFISESPANLLIAPKWGGVKNFEMVDLIDKKLTEKNLWQGKYYKS